MGDFAGAGKKPGLEIWRIEKLKPVRQPENGYGKFYSGDSYIVLHTVQKPGSSSFEWNVHFWLGKDTSQDEAGVAAYKTVELDDYLGGAPVQHRETQGHESNLFLSYFKQGVSYEDGGIESGFKHVERGVYETRLLHCKGRRFVRVSQVEVSHKSLNSGDVFILDTGLKIWQWNGKAASRQEKAKGLEVTLKIKNDERGGKAEVVAVDEGTESQDFWGALGGQGPVASADAGGSDEGVAKQPSKLHRVSDASGTLEVTQVGTAPLKKELLDTNDTFILDDGASLFAWIGKGATKDEKSSAMKFAMDFLAKENRPAHTPVTRVIEGGETPLFKQQFSNWTEQVLPIDFTRQGTGNIAKVEQKDVDIASLHISARAEEQMFDDGSGKIQVWRIENFAKADWPANLTGHFYAGDSFIVLYTYEKSGKEEFVIYFWQGRDSSTDEKGASALLAKQIDDELGGRPTQVRVVQGKEPTHFLRLFKGKMVVHSGGCASGFKNINAEDTYDTDGVSLFHVRGTDANNTRAVQVEEKAASLNSGDCFVLLTPDTQYVWFGKGANSDEKTVARSVANEMKGNRALKEVSEGEEDDAFWAPLGGKGEYANTKELQDAPREPRLFQCSNANGYFDVEEIPNFSQDDLIDDDVMLLDAYNELFIWIGSQSNEQEKKMAFETAHKYNNAATDGRSKDTPIVGVTAGNEPPLFTCHFLGWDASKASVFEDPYAKRLAALNASQKDEEELPGTISAPRASVSASYQDPNSLKKPYDELKNGGLPDGVDPTRKEEYLSDAEFQTVFGQSRDEYSKLAGWKKQNKKKEVGLF